MSADLPYWLAFSLTGGIGPARMARLIAHFGSVRAAWLAAPDALRSSGLDERTLDSLFKARPRLDLDAEMRRVEKVGARLIVATDAEYPPLLRHISDPPYLLYVKGALRPDDTQVLASVGTRVATDYGKHMAQRIIGPLAEAGFGIVSGLAVGIDTASHLAALNANGYTVAVLPCGIDRVYPPENAALAERIAARGALITELPLGTQVTKTSFAPRNRIISGMARGVLIVEAAERSGSLLTADHALSQGREVFAVPGSATSPASSGTNALIRSGATMTTEAANILDALGMGEFRFSERPPVSLPPPPKPPAQRPVQKTAPAPPPVYQPSNPVEAAILEALRKESPLHVDDLAAACGLSVAQVVGALTILEMQGAVQQAGAMRYAPDEG